jgi:hypothetical protein
MTGEQSLNDDKAKSLWLVYICKSVYSASTSNEEIGVLRDDWLGMDSACRIRKLEVQGCGVAVDMERYSQNASGERQFPPDLQRHKKTYRESGSDRLMRYLIVDIRHEAARIVPTNEAANDGSHRPNTLEWDTPRNYAHAL